MLYKENTFSTITRLKCEPFFVGKNGAGVGLNGKE